MKAHGKQATNFRFSESYIQQQKQQSPPGEKKGFFVGLRRTK